ncbi:MAG TPA: hypothetical protein VFE58_06020 [Tepidisphaeraceae bacterium]|jgi:hypothetical protein|nr:hypothetical protein [Tepidisphaeraceae bacterium]
MTAMLAKYQAQAVGYTVVKHDPDGTPVVNVWALSPVAFAGMCGNSSWAERRHAAMRVWRNM